MILKMQFNRSNDGQPVGSSGNFFFCKPIFLLEVLSFDESHGVGSQSIQ